MALDLGIFLEGAESIFKAKVSSNDTQPDYLINKFTSSDASVTITETNDGGVEVIDLTTAGGGSGVDYGDTYGISDGSGAYTTYSTLSAAIAGASSGDVIEVFGNITESMGTSVTIDKSLKINGNGHTITFDDVSASYLIISGAFTVDFYNITISRVNGTSAAYGIRLNNASAKVYGHNSTRFKTDNGANGVYISNSTAEVIGVIGDSSSGNGIRNDGICRDSKGLSGTSAGIGMNNANAYIDNCLGVGAWGILITTGNANNCRGFAHTNPGIRATGTARIDNCYAFSNADSAVFLDGVVTMTNTKGYSTAGKGIECDNAGGDIVFMENCIGESTSSFGIDVGNFSAKTRLSNCTAISSVAAASFFDNDTDIDGGSFYCSWNNSAGHAIYVSVSDLVTIFGATMEVTNASANCIYGNAAYNVKYGNNVYKTATTAVNANITQTQTNTPDTYGNIKIG